MAAIGTVYVLMEECAYDDYVLMEEHAYDDAVIRGIYREQSDAEAERARLIKDVDFPAEFLRVVEYDLI